MVSLEGLLVDLLVLLVHLVDVLGASVVVFSLVSFLTVLDFLLMLSLCAVIVRGVSFADASFNIAVPRFTFLF